MELKKMVTVPASTREVVDQTLCDLCKVDIDAGGSIYDTRDVTVEMRFGVSYPEGAHGEVTAFDLCCMCFKRKLVPWMASQGAKPRVVEYGL